MCYMRREPGVDVRSAVREKRAGLRSEGGREEEEEKEDERRRIGCRGGRGKEEKSMLEGGKSAEGKLQQPGVVVVCEGRDNLEPSRSS